MSSLFLLLREKAIANEMIELYRLIYDTEEIFFYTKSREREYADIRHCIRAFLAEKHDVGSSMIARAESQIPKLLGIDYTQSVNHATIMNSVDVVQNTLPSSNPHLVEKLRELILSQ